MRFADLHLHSARSDGSDAPATVIQRAHAAGLSAVALTDHDTASGCAEAIAEGERLGIEVLAGIEISSRYASVDVHILGLGIGSNHDAMRQCDARMRQAREDRARQTVAQLHATGVELSWADIQRAAGDGVVTRSHIAQALHNLGHGTSAQDAFKRHLHPGRAGYAQLDCPGAEEATDMIHEAGGLAFVAHPGLGANTRRILPHLLKLPFDGIEVFHTHHKPSTTGELLEVAKLHGLLITGGSDCHGAANGNARMGKTKLGWKYYEAIKGRL